MKLTGRFRSPRTITPVQDSVEKRTAKRNKTVSDVSGSLLA